MPEFETTRLIKEWNETINRTQNLIGINLVGLAVREIREITN